MRIRNSSVTSVVAPANTNITVKLAILIYISNLKAWILFYLRSTVDAFRSICKQADTFLIFCATVHYSQVHFARNDSIAFAPQEI